MQAAQTPRVLLDLSADELGHVLKFLPDAEAIARTAEVCRTLKLGASRAADARAAAAPVPLPPLNPGEPKLRAVRWAEAAGTCPRQTLAAGEYHSLLISASGDLCVFGGDDEDQEDETDYMFPLGLGPEQREAVLRPRPLSLKATQCSSAGVSSMAVSADGAVWSWGNNQDGRLGHGDTRHRSRPERIASLADTRILQVACGGDYALLLTAAGAVLEFGRNAYIRNAALLQPTEVAGFADRRVVQVSAADAICAAVDEAGGLWMWGVVDFGSDNEIIHEQPTRVTDGNMGRVRHVSVDRSHALVTTATGALYAWGRCAVGHLGLGEDVAQGAVVLLVPQHVTAFASTPVRMAVAASGHSLVLTEAGDVYTMGDNRIGMLGHGDKERRYVPTVVDALAQPLTEEEKRALETIHARQGIWARLGIGVSEMVEQARRLLTANRGGRSPVVEVATGDHHCLAKCADGTIFSWGRGDSGQLGHGVDTQDQLVPKQIESSVLSPTSGAQ